MICANLPLAADRWPSAAICGLADPRSWGIGRMGSGHLREESALRAAEALRCCRQPAVDDSFISSHLQWNGDQKGAVGYVGNGKCKEGN
jgi:hypothetical protein